MQENFSTGQRLAMLHNYNKGDKLNNLTSFPSGMAKVCKLARKQQLCKPNHECCAGFPCEPVHNHACEGFDKPCSPNEGCYACDTHPAVAGKMFSNTRQYNIPQSMNPNLLKIAGGAPERFSGKIDNSKYGNYGTSMLQPVETFCPGASNARINGAALDMSWASGTMDAICRRGAQPFTPARYGQYKA
jgi:hypothetical protein